MQSSGRSHEYRPGDSRFRIRWFAAVVAFGILARAVLWLWAAAAVPDDLLRESLRTQFMPLYHEALTEHFWAYLGFAHTLTPLSVIFDFGLHSFVAPADHGVARVLVLSALGSIAGGLVFLTLRNFAVPLWASVAVALLCSLRLYVWDVWYLGGY